MIRINLLPQARKAARSTSRAASGTQNLWAGIYLVSIVVWGAILAGVYFMKSGELDLQLAANQRLEAEIAEKRTRSARLEEVRAQLEQSYALERVVDELNKARTGPTRVMMELSNILSMNKGPTIDPEALEQLRRDNPHAGYNPGWDVHRLWLSSFQEEDRQCTIAGRGRTNEDVAEFLKRLALSELFTSVTLQRTEAVKDDETDLDFIGFELTSQVTY